MEKFKPSMIKKLRKSYPSVYGVPIISRVDTIIFQQKYFAHCLQCNFCKDWCCSDGVDVDAENFQRIQEHAEDLETYVGIPREQWFEPEAIEDDELPGGACYRTNAVDGACVFLNRTGRGCLLQSYSEEKGIDYHNLKPIVSALFPLTFENGLLLAADEVEDQSLVCLDQGLSLYRGARPELLYYFGPEMISELDALEEETSQYGDQTPVEESMLS